MFNNKYYVKFRYADITLKRTLEGNISLCRELGLSFIELNMNFREYQIDKIENVEYF